MDCQRGGSGLSVGAECGSGLDRCRGDCDAVGLELVIRAAGVRDRQFHGVRAGCGVGIGRTLKVRVDRAVIVEVPGPCRRAAARGIGELDGERCNTGGPVSAEGGDGRHGRGRSGDDLEPIDALAGGGYIIVAIIEPYHVRARR